MSRIGLEVRRRRWGGPLDAGAVREVLTDFLGHDVGDLARPGADEWFWQGEVIVADIGVECRGAGIEAVYMGLSGWSNERLDVDRAECRTMAQLALRLGHRLGLPVRAGDGELTEENLEEALDYF